jgi:hypothetical protein
VGGDRRDCFLARCLLPAEHSSSRFHRYHDDLLFSSQKDTEATEASNMHERSDCALDYLPFYNIALIVDADAPPNSYPGN